MKRSEFIKKSTLASAGFMILPRHVLGGKGFVAPSDKLVIATIGCGGEGDNDIQHLAKTPNNNSTIGFLCDVDQRQAAPKRKQFPKAKFYEDWRELFDKEGKHFDAVTVAIPDHNHAIVGLRAMQMKKHLYLQKPLTHDIHEARIITQAASKYQVVTQMGDQGASCEGMQTMREWIEADLIGEISKVYCWTDRPVWPQGISWPKTPSRIPKELNWDLWLGTAQRTNYIENLVPFNWRGWWDFGTGALGDMGCHIMGPPFKLLKLGYPHEVSGSASTTYSGVFKESAFPESGPISSSLKYRFTMNNGKDLDLYWMDGGITPERLQALAPEVNMNDALGDFPGENDFEGSTLFVGTKGVIACGWGGSHPRLFSKELQEAASHIPQKYARVKGGMDGHWWQWIDASIAGYGQMEVSSPFEGYGGPLTETVLLGNLLLRSFNIREKVKRMDPVYGAMESYAYSGRYKALKWDGANMRVTNYEPANQFISRSYRKGWADLVL